MRNVGKKWILGLLTAVIGASLLFSGCGLGKMAREHQATQGGPVELKLAYHLPQDHYLSQGMERFAQRVNER